MSKKGDRTKFPEFLEIARFSTDTTIKDIIIDMSKGIFRVGVSYTKPTLVIGDESITIDKNHLPIYLKITSALSKMKKKSQDTVSDMKIDDVEFSKQSQQQRSFMIYAYANTLAKQHNMSHRNMQKLSFLLEVYIACGNIRESDIVISGKEISSIEGISDIISILH